MQRMLARSCPVHYTTDNPDKSLICGCPRTDRRKGFIIYQDLYYHLKWIVWDCSQWKWVIIADTWESAFESYKRRVKDIPLEPARCYASCSQNPCGHDWRPWYLSDKPTMDLTNM